MNETWTLQDAKARFSELVRRCLEEGPQRVTRHGEAAVVVVPAAEYDRVVSPREDLASFLLAAPRVVLDTTRSDDPGREVVL